MTQDKVYNVLFLCTQNSSRSLMAEAMLNAFGRGRFKAYSAGSFPSGRVDPKTIEFLRELGLPTQDLRSKSWDEFNAAGAPEMDFILTVCNDTAQDPCPVWPGHPLTAHWSHADPAKVKGSDDARHHAFLNTAAELRKRIELFVALPTTALDRISLQTQLDAIGQ